MLPAKITTLGLLEIRVFWIKVVLSWMWFVNPRSSIWEVIEFDQNNHFFEGWSWFKFNNLRLALGMALKFYSRVRKWLKLTVRKFWGLHFTLVVVTGKQWVRWLGGGGILNPTPFPLPNMAIPNWWGILVYKLITSSMTISVSSSRSLGHLITISKLSRIKLLMCFNKDLPINWLSFLVGHLGPPTAGLSFRSFGSKVSMVSLFLMFIADSIILGNFR